MPLLDRLYEIAILKSLSARCNPYAPGLSCAFLCVHKYGDNKWKGKRKITIFEENNNTCTMDEKELRKIKSLINLLVVAVFLQSILLLILNLR